MMWWRGFTGTLAALGLMTGSAQAFQVGVFVQPGKSGIVQARFVAAEWEASDLTVQAADGGRTIVFHDAKGVIGKNPPPAKPWPMQPCQTIDQHTARCHSTAVLQVIATLGDAGARYRDLAPGSGTPDPQEIVLSGAGNDDVAIHHGHYSGIDDAGGSNSLVITSGPGSWVTAFNGIRNTIDLRNGLSGDTAQCRLGLAARGTDALQSQIVGPYADEPLADHGVGDTVLADPGDTIQGCENDLPGS